MRLRIAGALGLTLALLSGWAAPALAGPPFQTDDPEPVDYGHYEFYSFATWDKTGEDRSTQGPAFEFNYGALPNMQLHIVAPMASYAPAGGPTQRGFGDSEFGVKFRFVQESAGRPQVGIFPMLEMATGDASRGLGNGQTWLRLPLWIQKSYGPWTTYGGGGYAINHAPGASNYGFGGWLVQRDLSDKLTLGGELFTQGASSVGAIGYTTYNLGGQVNFNPDFSLLFSVGHSLAGEQHAIGYLGFYWTWGKSPLGEKKAP